MHELISVFSVKVKAKGAGEDEEEEEVEEEEQAEEVVGIDFTSSTLL